MSYNKKTHKKTVVGKYDRDPSKIYFVRGDGTLGMANRKGSKSRPKSKSRSKSSRRH